MSKRRGLPTAVRMRHDAHFVEELAAEQGRGVGEMIPLEALRPNPNQPRKAFDDLEELIASIERVGVLEPLLVRREDHGYEIVSGERRYRASQAAGLEDVPCIVLELDDAEALEIALIENLQREDLSAFEEAEGLQALVDQFGLTHDEVAVRISKSRTTVTETLRLASVPGSVRTVMEAGDVSSKSVLLEIARADSEEEMLALARRVVDEGLKRDDIRDLRRAPTEAEDPDEESETGQHDDDEEKGKAPPRRLTFRSKTGITVSVYVSSEQVSLSDIERSLMEAIRDLRSTGIPNSTA